MKQDNIVNENGWMVLVPDSRIWNDLNDQRVQFKSEHRPRARYLYWQSAIALLRKAFQSDHKMNNPVAAELGKRYWGTGGPWIRRKHLLAFTEYLGHEVEWETHLEAATEPEDDDNEPDPGGLVMAVEQIRNTRRKLTKGWYEEEGEEEDEEGEEEEEEDWT